MALTIPILRALTKSNSEEAWRVIINSTLDIASRPLTVGNAPSEVTKRDREIATLDLFLASSGWDLWQDIGNVVERTSDRLARWWSEPYSAKAVLILDGLSLRELPWLLQGAKQRGFTVHEVAAHASELPGETNEFAQALGFGSRSQLQNNGAGRTHRLALARTESVDLPWRDCASLLDPSPNWIFWHHWPDSKVHGLSGAGQGLDVLTRNVAEQLADDDFWHFVERLATGRRLVITSDHGYAATGLFSDTANDQTDVLKTIFRSGRSIAGTANTGPFVPPVALQINSPHGPHVLALGRRKWRSQGGYPTLAHGGLSLLEVLSPFIELTT